MTADKKGGHKNYGDYGRLPDNVFEGYNPEKNPSIYRTTNALVFPLKLIDDEEVLRGDDLSAEIEG
ncbi:MAG TPA: hypothetical protein VFF83_00390 [Clostridia bacterium]|jgi:hypothetical protein|nr:hypothetical protein [Clostridia bacterium]